MVDYGLWHFYLYLSLKLCWTAAVLADFRIHPTLKKNTHKCRYRILEPITNWGWSQWAKRFCQLQCFHILFPSLPTYLHTYFLHSCMKSARFQELWRTLRATGLKTARIKEFSVLTQNEDKRNHSITAAISKTLCASNDEIQLCLMSEQAYLLKFGSD